jgi:hypothetical protein
MKNKDVNINIRRINYKMLFIGGTVSIVVNFIMIWAAHNVSNWNQPIFNFVKDVEFKTILWAIDLSLGASILTQLIKMAFPDRRIKSIMLIIDNFFTLVLLVVVFNVFPYDFTQLINISWINTAFKVIFAISIFGSIVSSIKELTSLIKNSIYYNND